MSFNHKRLCLLFVTLYILVKIAMTVYYWYTLDNSVPIDSSINSMFAFALIFLNFFDVCMGSLYHYLREHFSTFEPKCTHKSQTGFYDSLLFIFYFIQAIIVTVEAFTSRDVDDDNTFRVLRIITQIFVPIGMTTTYIVILYMVYRYAKK